MTNETLCDLRTSTFLIFSVPYYTVGAPSFAAHVSVLHTRKIVAAKGGLQSGGSFTGLEFLHWVAVRIARGRALQCGAWPQADGNSRLPGAAHAGG